MDEKYLHTLEFDKVLDRLAAYCAFSGGAALVRALRPTPRLDTARRWQEETAEARKLLAVKSDVTLGGARDVRQFAANAAIRGVLQPGEILDIKNTLVAARTLKRTIGKMHDQFPRLAVIASGIDDCPGIVEAISRTIDDRGEVLSSASEKLAVIRHDLKIAYDRLLQKLEAIVNSSRYQPYLQDTIVTQRDGRFVIPLKADFKGKLRGIVHDQSSSGATLFIEPMATVDLNNRWRELQLAEQEEIRRILAALCEIIGEQAEAIRFNVEALAELDLAFSKAKYADALRASEATLVAPAVAAANPATNRTHPGSIIELRQARHPLLDPTIVVPIDFVLDNQTYVVVITGPNTGGKTVSLKTVGLLALMAQSGLHLPAQSGSCLSMFEGIYADIGDEQSIEQNLSTFSSHVKTIIGILGKANSRSLVILDELGAGTDPGEGSAIARAILSYLLDLGVTTLATTHYPELKIYAHTTAGVTNASVEFDLETLAPTYHLTIGLPGRSNAFAIAQRLGLDATIIDEARKMMPANDLAAEQLLDEIHRQRDLARQERALAEAVRSDAVALEANLSRRLEQIDNERRKIINAARAEVQTEIDALQQEARELRRKLQSAGLSLTAVRQIEIDAAQLADTAAAPVSSIDTDLPGIVPKGPVRLGESVWLPNLKTEGTVLSLTATEAEVQIGRLRVRAKLDELQSLKEKKAADRPAMPTPASRGRVAQPAAPVAASPGLEIDLRGQTVDEGLMALDRYLDSAYAAGLPWVRIIHGKGTGKLRQAIREALSANSVVSSHERGADTEGGDGVTVARLAVGD